MNIFVPLKKSLKNISNKNRYFSVPPAFLTEGYVSIKKYWIQLIGILLIGIFLRIYHIQESMFFIGDQGWFYLSARDMLLTGDIPLVGIASSHPWLHQGALWTYLLGIGFRLFGFNPFIGAYLSVGLGILGILGIYMLGSSLFSTRVGLVACALFASSPLIVASDRMPYHTSPIPLFTILLIYFLHKWVSGSKLFFPLIIFDLGVLYNLEIATALWGIITLVVWLYGYTTDKSWAKGIFSGKILTLSIIAFVVSMLPMLVYDFGHDFPQTLGFVAWLGYKVLLFFGFTPLGPSSSIHHNDIFYFFMNQVREIIFPYSGIVSLGIFVGSLIYSFRAGILINAAKLKKGMRHVNVASGTVFLFVVNIFLMLGFFAARTASSAYLPMMFPGIILLIAVWFEAMIVSKARIIRGMGLVGIISIVTLNVYYLVTYNYGSSFENKMNAASYIVKESAGKGYNLKGRGEASKFESFTMNYEYLVWHLGNGPSKVRQDLEFVILEEDRKIIIEKNFRGIRSTKSF